MKVFYSVCFIICFSGLSFAKSPIKWATVDYPPAYYKTTNKEVKGYLYEIAIEALEKRLKIPVSISFFPWKRSQMMVQTGKHDMLFTIPTTERLQYSITHKKAAWVKKRIMYTYKKHPRIKEIHNLKGLGSLKKKDFILLSYLGNGWMKAVFDKGAGISVDYATKIELMYKMLAAKRGDIIIEQPSLAVPNIKRLKLTDKIVETRGIGMESDFHILIGKKSKYSYIIPKLNKVIEKMWRDGTIAKILKKYKQ
ncbi:MAG: amino acid ABC transporter substrate-binding protein [Deltaproteobacteria bacterium]|nr:amino acid ABC transporter substrate-binding protein [Deltaproteobacteria bacterium]